MVNLSDAILVLVPTANFGLGGTVQLVDLGDGQGPRITAWNTGVLGPQPTAQQLAAVTVQQVSDYYTGLQRAAADTLLSDTAAANKALRAVLLSVIDQFNTLREWCMSLQSGTAGVATLAAFKTMVAGLPSLPDITAPVAKAAVKSKIDGGQAD